MHFYLVDDFVADRKFESVIDRITARLTELGIPGRLERLTILKHAGELVTEAVRRGADTVVAIGDDRTISKLVSVVAALDVPFGIIPVGPHQAIARSLGVPDGVAACDVLSRRVVERVDLGRVGDRYFLMSLDVPEAQYSLECDGKYRVSFAAAEPMSVKNFALSGQHNPKDGVLEAVIGSGERSGMFSGLFRKNESARSVLPFKRMTITAPETLSLLLDGQTVVKTPVTVEATPKKLKVIVGRDRAF